MDGRDGQVPMRSRVSETLVGGTMRDPRAMDRMDALSGPPQPESRLTEMGNIMRSAEVLEKLACVLYERTSYIEARLLSPIPSGGVATARETPQPSNLLGVLEERQRNAIRGLEAALGNIDRLQRELID